MIRAHALRRQPFYIGCPIAMHHRFRWTSQKVPTLPPSGVAMSALSQRVAIRCRYGIDGANRSRRCLANHASYFSSEPCNGPASVKAGAPWEFCSHRECLHGQRMQGCTSWPLSRRVKLRRRGVCATATRVSASTRLRALFQITVSLAISSSASYLRHEPIAWPSVSAIY